MCVCVLTAVLSALGSVYSSYTDETPLTSYEESHCSPPSSAHCIIITIIITIFILTTTAIITINLHQTSNSFPDEFFIYQQRL